jgi:hypothetical protein
VSKGRILLFSAIPRRVYAIENAWPAPNRNTGPGK